MSPYIPVQLAKNSVFLSDAVLCPGLYPVPDKEKKWNLGIRDALENNGFALVASYRAENNRGTACRIFSKPIPDFDAAQQVLIKERAIWQELGYNVR